MEFMPFFYKHIVPTGLKMVLKKKKYGLKQLVYVKLYLTYSYLAQLVKLSKNRKFYS